MEDGTKEVAQSYEAYSKETLSKYSKENSSFSKKEAESVSKQVGEGIIGYESYLEEGGHKNTLETVNQYAESIKDEVIQSTGDEAAAEFAKEMVTSALKPLEYLVRGAKLKCDCGSHTRQLDLRRCHGLHLCTIPMMHEKDCRTGENILPFGVCSNPVRIQEGELNGENKEIYETEENPQKNVKGFICQPKILSAGEEVEEVELDSGLSYGFKKYVKNPFKRWINTAKEIELTQAGNNPAWNEPKEDAYVRRKKLITTDSWLQCAYGGIITPITSGQEAAKEGE